MDLKHKIFNFAVFFAATVATTPFWPVAAHADSNEKVVSEPQSDTSSPFQMKETATS